MTTMHRRRRPAIGSQGWADQEQNRLGSPRFGEADRIAHTILLLVVLAFAFGMLLGRAGWPL